MLKFEKDYFVNSKVSNYKDYRKKKFSQLARDIIKHTRGYQIIDFGCGTGALLAQIKKISYEFELKGTDISQWSIEFGIKQYNLEKELQYYNRNILRTADEHTTVLFLDVLEHLPEYEIEFLLTLLKNSGARIILRVPVSSKEGCDYVLDVSKNDKTHIQVHCKKWWKEKLKKYGFKLTKKLKEGAIYDSKGVLAGVFE